MYCSGFKKIIKSAFFPRKFARNSKKLRKIRYTYILGIGGNIANEKEVKSRFERLIVKLEKDRRFKLVKSSPIIKNKAFGYENQADFLNAVLEIKSSLYALKVLKIMLNYEKIFGRKRSFKNAPRTLDIDIIDFSAKIRQSERLRLPHPKACQRLSVILPLAMM
ncbi:2-amino-4-hydroxy-6-hydroxymethyldihydropteridine diphosphokinase [Campylobacter magnus]|uniref:2-amino-4-hydroxy-6-hydroxymethyldihydropteridine pyrophosphokinase n=1 Tax=Campylobacter magnus TaxID=3026462 RepID=A0ABT8T8K0_9BACT|nr:2-amino-4-hydroxy-6-hydroxymethyldihydropteridine diphosphokinase [Campylobacter magnus]MDO2409836.1 2-amino-4-hydroxy-6-hydroxymethyldihydropteridine diphosphokinase [Campylobacter magnus]